MNTPTTQNLRLLLDNPERTGPLLVPGVANALSALIAERAGFEVLYVTGAGVANTYLGVPDIGLVSFAELRDHVIAIRGVTDRPLIVDADTGFGNAVSVYRTMQQLEAAGANAIQLEDQMAPKKCGHFEGKRVVEVSEMVQKIHAAVDGRRSDDTLVIARTDARAVEGYDAALERILAYQDAGADLTFLEAPTTVDELLAVPQRMRVPQVANMVEGGVTPLVPADQLAEFGLVLFANASLQAAMRGMELVMGRLRESGSLAEVQSDLTPWDGRQAIVRKPWFDQLESKYAN